MTTAVTNRRLHTVLDTLAQLTEEQHPEMDGKVRDEIAHVRYVLHEILDRRERPT